MPDCHTLSHKINFEFWSIFYREQEYHSNNQNTNKLAPQLNAQLHPCVLTNDAENKHL